MVDDIKQQQQQQQQQKFSICEWKIKYHYS